MRSLVQAVLGVLFATTTAACFQPALAPGEVRLATSPEGAFDVGCPANRIDGTLVVDPGSGTAIVNGSETTPVISPEEPSRPIIVGALADPSHERHVAWRRARS